MRRAFKALNAAYTPLTRKALAGTLLDRIHSKLKTDVVDYVSSLQWINIVTDESTDVNSVRISNISIHLDLRSIYWSLEDVGSTQMKAETLSPLIRGKTNGDNPK